MSEFELKFGVDAARADILDRLLRREGSRRIVLQSRYVDTADFRLGGAGLSLRLRRAGRLWEQTLKAPSGGPAERLEATVARPGRWGPHGPPLDQSLHGGTKAGAALRQALGDAADAPLVPVSTTRVVRRSAEIDLGAATVEIALDRGAIEAAGRSVRLDELELELKAGDPLALVEWARNGVLEHGLWLRSTSKAERGERLARGGAAAAPTKACAPTLHRSMRGPALRRAGMKACLVAVLANAGELADGNDDAEVVHRLRVGLRRLRTAWRELSEPASGDDPAWERPLVDAFRALGVLRDRQVVIESLEARLRAAGSPEPQLPLPQAEGPQSDALSIVRAPAFQVALLDAMALALARDDDDAPGGADAVAAVSARLEALHRQLRRAARSFERDAAPAQHRARKRLKRLRYLAELAASLYKAKRVERYLERLRPAQDALGRHVDLLVGLDLARRAAQAGDDVAWFNVGWLSAELRGSAEMGRRALRRAARAERFWPRP
jgi:CHAD domain-containing protein